MSGHGPQKDLLLVGELVAAVLADARDRQTCASDGEDGRGARRTPRAPAASVPLDLPLGEGTSPFPQTPRLAIANAKEDLLLHMRRLRAVAEGALRVAGIKQDNIDRVLEDMYGGDDE